MIDRSNRIIILTGAPLSISLDWREKALCAPLQPCFSQSIKTSLVPVLDVNANPAWRSLPLERNRLPTGLSQASRVDEEPDHGEEASFLTADELSLVSSSPDRNCLQASQVSLYSDSDLLSQFYERSFTIHDEIPFSKITQLYSSVDTSFTTDYDSTSLLSSDSPEVASGKHLPQAVPFSGRVIDLRDVPNAAYLRSIEPQTMTVNLVAGIIAIPQPRVITTRKDRRSVELVEMLIGDDTKAGFGINIWLHCHESGITGGGLQSKMAQLRPQDVVLVRNVALSSFRGKVYGQSLRKNTTTLDLLYRNALDVHDRQGIYSAQELETRGAEDSYVGKVATVKQWVMTFVGAGANPRQHTTPNATRRERGFNQGQLVTLPPDSQP